MLILWGSYLNLSATRYIELQHVFEDETDVRWMVMPTQFVIAGKFNKAELLKKIIALKIGELDVSLGEFVGWSDVTLLKNFTVEVVRTVKYSNTVDVEAYDEDDALARLRENPPRLPGVASGKWNVDDEDDEFKNPEEQK